MMGSATRTTAISRTNASVPISGGHEGEQSQSRHGRQYVSQFDHGVPRPNSRETESADVFGA